jgi:hypothetical protein
MKTENRNDKTITEDDCRKSPWDFNLYLITVFSQSPAPFFNPIRAAVILLALTTLIGCSGGSGGGGGSVVAESPSPLVPVSEAVSVTVKSGRGFECFALKQTVYCRGNSVNLDVDVNSVEFEEYYRDEDSDILTFKVWDDTVCIHSIVAERNSSASTDAGHAIFCIGEATFQGTNVPTVKYDWTFFSNPSNLPSDITTSRIPCFEYDDFDQYTMNSIGNTFITDGTAMTALNTENCERTGTDLVCETFNSEVRDE